MESNIDQISTGTPGLDELMHGGLGEGRMYLIQGEPGTGKTLIGMHFIERGVQNEETVLYIHGEESKNEILSNASELNIELEDSDFLDLGPDSNFFTEDLSYDLVDPSDIERSKYTEDIHNAIREINPQRVVIDPITQLKYVESSNYQFRKQLLSFMRFLKNRDITVMATATQAPNQEFDIEIRSLSDGIIRLRRGEGGRRVQVLKHRGVGQIEGEHGLEIRGDGIEVYPSLDPGVPNRSSVEGTLTSGIRELDEMLDGGFDHGSVTFITGPTGAGKTSLGSKFLTESADDDKKSTVYLFEETEDVFKKRAESLGIPVGRAQEEGRLEIEEVEPMALSAEEFAARVRQKVEGQETDIVMIDGIDGYTMSIQGGKDSLVKKLHSLTRHLRNQGVTVIVTDEVTEVTGIVTATSANLSYISDNILFIRYIEIDGQLQKVLGVLKKRTGGFDHDLRAFEMTEEGLKIGRSMEGVSGILQGTAERRRD